MDTSSPEWHKQFMLAVKDLNFQAAPGLGQFRHYSSVGQALGYTGLTFENKLNLELLKSLVISRIHALKAGVVSPVPLKMFIKEEPLSEKKCLEGRARLIFSLALEDQVVDKILFGAWHRAEERNSSFVPNKVGWSPVPEGFWLVKRDFPLTDPLPLATDCSAFDWTFPAWAVPIILQQKLDQAVILDHDYETAARTRFSEVLGTNCLVRFPDGRLVRQQFTGLMKSGWLLTISCNGWCQFLLNALAWSRTHPEWPLPVMWTMGDDVLIAWSNVFDQDLFESNLNMTGIIVKRGNRDREFAGFRFERNGDQFYVNPLYVTKHQFQLQYYTEDELHKVVDMYACIYALASPEVSAWFEPIRRKYGHRTPVWYRAWALGLPLSGLDSIKTSDFEF